MALVPVSAVFLNGSGSFLQQAKKMKKILDFYCFVTWLWLFIFEECCNIKSYRKKKIFLSVPWRSMTNRARSGAGSAAWYGSRYFIQRYGSEDPHPDPYQNVRYMAGTLSLPWPHVLQGWRRVRLHGERRGSRPTPVREEPLPLSHGNPVCALERGTFVKDGNPVRILVKIAGLPVYFLPTGPLVWNDNVFS